jgi:hypothetical protein
MALDKFTKQPWEVLDYDFDFSTWFAGRTDAPATFEIVADAGIDVDTSIRQGNVVKVFIGGGEDGQDYKVSCRMQTTSPARREWDILIKVREQ